MIPLTRWLDHLRANISVARDGTDPEGAHQVRVSCRRLVVWLELSGLRVLRDDLGWLRRHAGAVRDLDVLLARKTPAPFHAWMARRRRAARRELVGALDSGRLTALDVALGLLPALPDRRAARAIPALARATLALGRELDGAPEELERLHGLRRSVRRLRYALEWIDADTGSFRDLQEVFGEVADLASALRLLDAYGGAGVTRFRRALAGEVEASRARAHEAWGGARRHVATWSRR